MSLFSSIERALQTQIAEVVDDKIQVIDLDVKRVGGDISTLATKLGELMEGLKNHKEAIQSLAAQHHDLVSTINSKGTRLAFPPLYKGVPVGPN